MPNYNSFQEFYFPFRVLFLLAIICLSFACGGSQANDNREVELARKETELAKKETELLKKELEVKKSEASYGNSNNREPKPNRPTSQLTSEVRPAIPSSDCDSGHWIQSVSSDGLIITLEDGSIWKVDSVDTVISSFWLPITDVVVCDDKIINTDDNESVVVVRLK